MKMNSLEKYRTQIHNPGLAAGIILPIFGSTSASRSLTMRELNSHTPNPSRVILEKYPALERLVLPMIAR